MSPLFEQVIDMLRRAQTENPRVDPEHYVLEAGRNLIPELMRDALVHFRAEAGSPEMLLWGFTVKKVADPSRVALVPKEPSFENRVYSIKRGLRDHVAEVLERKKQEEALLKQGRRPLPPLTFPPPDGNFGTITASFPFNIKDPLE